MSTRTMKFVAEIIALGMLAVTGCSNSNNEAVSLPARPFSFSKSDVTAVEISQSRGNLQWKARVVRDPETQQWLIATASTTVTDRQANHLLIESLLDSLNRFELDLPLEGDFESLGKIVFQTTTGDFELQIGRRLEAGREVLAPFFSKLKFQARGALLGFWDHVDELKSIRRTVLISAERDSIYTASLTTASKKRTLTAEQLEPFIHLRIKEFDAFSKPSVKPKAVLNLTLRNRTTEIVEFFEANGDWTAWSSTRPGTSFRLYPGTSRILKP